MLHEASVLRLDVNKALTLLGWQQRWSLSQALEETVTWYKAWDAGEDMHAFSLHQIAAYEAEC